MPLRPGFKRLSTVLIICLGVAGVTAGCAPLYGGYGSSSQSGGAGGIVIVEKGDTLYGISRRHNIELRELIAANNLRPPYTLLVNQRLLLPGPRHHVVRKGETVYGISRTYGVDMRTLIKSNRMQPPYTIFVGQRLQLPGAARGTVAKGPPPAALPPPPPRTSGRFAWPVKGQVVNGFGAKGNGLHNDGINIAAARGTPVQAAENGVIAYAGNGLEGFGNLVLIKHSDGWVTAYAHNQRLLIKRGDKVARGQPIAEVGATGNVSSPQLHFEIRRGRRAVDPMGQLGPLQRAALAP